MQRLFAALLLLPCVAFADITGTVTGVSDGDTITVLTPELKEYKVRLVGIDAPEKGQAFGKAAKQRLADALFQKEVTVEHPKKIRNERYAGQVLREGRDVGLIMINEGYAWHYREYQKSLSIEERQAYARAERAAIQAKIGLWVDKNPMAPWDWRKLKATKNGLETLLPDPSR